MLLSKKWFCWADNDEEEHLLGGFYAKLFWPPALDGEEDACTDDGHSLLIVGIVGLVHFAVPSYD